MEDCLISLFFICYALILCLRLEFLFCSLSGRCFATGYIIFTKNKVTMTFMDFRSFLSPHKSVDSNSFWTSHHLDKIRLCKSPVTKNLDRQFNAFSHFNIFYPVDKVSTSDINIDSELPDSDLNVPALKSYIQSGNIEMGKVYHL